MIHVYRGNSRSATHVVKALETEVPNGVVRKRDFSGAAPAANDLVVNWGAYIERWPATWHNILNPRIIGDKYRELQLLAAAGLPVPPHTRTRPRTGRWLARTDDHFEANDLRAELRAGAFYTEWLDIEEEFRFHIVRGVCIRKQYKEAEDGAHPWIRSSASGWDWYNGGGGNPAERNAAIRAVAAVEYDFGAVDVGRLRLGGFVILEVNAGPGIDGGGSTVREYAKAFVKAAREIA